MSKFRVQNFLMITIAGIVNAIGINLFLLPVQLYDGGISGTSMLLNILTPEYLTLPIFLILLNTPLFLFGLKKQGKEFTIYSIYAVYIYSLTSWFISVNPNIDISSGSPLAGQDLLLCAIFGGIISGIGSGLAIRYGGAIDGLEVIAVIFAKRLGLTVGTFVMIYNVIIYTIAGLITNNWLASLYSIITYAAGLKTIDFIVDGLDRAKCAIIITEQPKEVCNELCNTFGSGVTVISARGGYSNTEKTMIYFIVNRYQVVRMRELIHEIDNKAYITISEVADVFSNSKKD